MTTPAFACASPLPPSCPADPVRWASPERHSPEEHTLGRAWGPGWVGGTVFVGVGGGRTTGRKREPSGRDMGQGATNVRPFSTIQKPTSLPEGPSMTDPSTAPTDPTAKDVRPLTGGERRIRTTSSVTIVERVPPSTLGTRRGTNTARGGGPAPCAVGSCPRTRSSTGSASGAAACPPAGRPRPSPRCR